MVQYMYAMCMRCDWQFSTHMQCVFSVMGGSGHVCSVHAVWWHICRVYAMWWWLSTRMKCVCSVMGGSVCGYNVYAVWWVVQYTYAVCMQCEGWFSTRMQCVMIRSRQQAVLAPDHFVSRALDFSNFLHLIFCFVWDKCGAQRVTSNA